MPRAASPFSLPVERNLPDDILRDILLHGLYQEDPRATPRNRYLRTITSVSQLFRMVARDTAELWSSICVHWQHPRTPLHFYETCLQLSKSRPLDVYLTVHQSRSTVEARRIFDLLVTHSFRWQSLVLLCPPWFLAGYKPLSIDAPQLSCLAIDLKDLVPRRIGPPFYFAFIKTGKALTSVKFDGLRAPEWITADPSRFSAVRSLTLSSNRNLLNNVHLEDVFQFASALPNLEELNLLDCQMNLGNRRSGESCEYVQFPSLRQLVYYCPCDSAVFSKFEAPLLESISVDGRCGVGFPESISMRPSTFYPSQSAFPKLHTWIVDFQKAARSAWDQTDLVHEGIYDSLTELSRQFSTVGFRDVPSARIVEHLCRPIAGRWPCSGAKSLSFSRSHFNGDELTDDEMGTALCALVRARHCDHRHSQSDYLVTDTSKDGRLPAFPSVSLLNLRLSNVKVTQEVRECLSSSLSEFSEEHETTAQRQIFRAYRSFFLKS